MNIKKYKVIFSGEKEQVEMTMQAPRDSVAIQMWNALRLSTTMTSTLYDADRNDIIDERFNQHIQGFMACYDPLTKTLQYTEELKSLAIKRR